MDRYSKSDLYDGYRRSRNRLLLLDYDGTLMPFVSNPEKAVPDQNLISILKKLSGIKENEVFLISGRSSSWLETNFGFLPLNLVAEHGARHRRKTGEWFTEAQTHNEWKEQVHNILDIYVRKCPSSFVEEKEFSLVWHYRDADIEVGKLRAFELCSELIEYIHNRHLQILMGNKIVEVKQSGINKGKIIAQLLSESEYDYILAVGDDRTDEDMFKVLNDKQNSYTIKVGPEASYAQYNLHTPHMVLTLLEDLIHLPTSFPIG